MVKPHRQFWRAEGGERRLHHGDRVMAGPAAGPEPDRHVEPFAQDLDPVVVGRDPEIDLRVGPPEGIEPGQEPANRKGRVDTDLQDFDVPPPAEPVK